MQMVGKPFPWKPVIRLFVISRQAGASPQRREGSKRLLALTAAGLRISRDNDSGLSVEERALR
jgi:hypothetical protein